MGRRDFVTKHLLIGNCVPSSFSLTGVTEATDTAAEHPRLAIKLDHARVRLLGHGAAAKEPSRAATVRAADVPSKARNASRVGEQLVRCHGEEQRLHKLRKTCLQEKLIIEPAPCRRRGLEARKRFVQPIAAYFSQIGKLHTVQHIWRYDSLEQRKATRDAAWQVETWNDTVTQVRRLGSSTCYPTPRTLFAESYTRLCPFFARTRPSSSLTKCTHRSWSRCLGARCTESKWPRQAQKHDPGIEQTESSSNDTNFIPLCDVDKALLIKGTYLRAC